MVYHNNQRLGYERNKLTTSFQADRVGHDAAIERVAQSPALEPSEAFATCSLERPHLEAAGVNRDTATFEQTGNPLLFIGGGSGKCS